jgi:hypothetical protein
MRWFGVLLGSVELFAAELAVGDRVGAADVARHFAVGDAAHFQRVQAAEIGDLLEGQRGVVHEPDGGRLRHQDVSGHNVFPCGGNEGARPFGRAVKPIYRPFRVEMKRDCRRPEFAALAHARVVQRVRSRSRPISARPDAMDSSSAPGLDPRPARSGRWKIAAHSRTQRGAAGQEHPVDLAGAGWRRRGPHPQPSSMRASSGAIQPSNWLRFTPPTRANRAGLEAELREILRRQRLLQPGDRAVELVAVVLVESLTSRAIFSGSTASRTRRRISRMSRLARIRASWSQRAKAA